MTTTSTVASAIVHIVPNFWLIIYKVEELLVMTVDSCVCIWLDIFNLSQIANIRSKKSGICGEGYEGGWRLGSADFLRLGEKLT